MAQNVVEKMEQRHPEPAVTPMQMLQMALERGTDLDQLQKLMDLQERWEKNEARKAFVVALSDFKAAPPTLMKNKKASFGKDNSAKTEYEYATLPQVVGVIAPALSKHGLSHRWSTSQDDKAIVVTCTLTHVMGHSESVTLQAPADITGSKNAIQAIGSTVTYLERYSLLAITGLAAAGQDDDGGGVVTLIDDQQKAILLGLIKEVNADTALFCKFFRIDYIEMLSTKRFDEAKAMLEAKRKKVAK